MFKAFQKELFGCLRLRRQKDQLEGALSHSGQKHQVWYSMRYRFRRWSQDFRALLLWTLREEAHNCIEADGFDAVTSCRGHVFAPGARRGSGGLPRSFSTVWYEFTPTPS